MPSLAQRSFAAGELSPSLQGRADQARYGSGLATCRNFTVLKTGPATNRAGTEFIAEVKDSSVAAALLTFQFNDQQTYLLEFGDRYMRVYKAGAQVVVSGVADYAGGTSYQIGDLVVSVGVTYYCIQAGSGHTPASSPTYWHALTGSIYEMPTPYLTADLADLRYFESGDIITIVHPSYAPRELARTGDTAWTLTAISTTPDLVAPTGLVATAGTPSTVVATPGSGAATGGSSGGAFPDTYKVAAWDIGTGTQSVPSGDIISSDGADYVASAAHPITITWAAVGAAEGYAVYKRSVNSDPNGLIAIVPAGTLSFVDNGRTPASPVAESSSHAGGTKTFTYVVTSVDADGFESLQSAPVTCRGGTPTTADPNKVSWGLVAGATAYNVYKQLEGVYGYIGTSDGTNPFEDNNITPSSTEKPPTNQALFATTDHYPSCGCYSKQRLAFGNTNSEPEKVWLSRLGVFHDFSLSSPIQDDDSISFTLEGDKVNQVRALVELSRLLIFTSGGIHTLDGDANGVVTPTAINARKQSYTGAASIAPIVIGNNAIYVQARGGIVRDLRYDLQTDGYAGDDLTDFSQHLFANHTIRSMAYQQIPHSIVWAVRDDGVLLGLTYVREQQVVGWHHHDTDGTFEAVACIAEGDEDAVYVLVKRTINGATKRYIERLHTRVVTDVAVDAFFVDCGLTYDGRNTGSTTLSLGTATTWVYGEDLVITASASQFSAGDVGKAYRLTVGSDSVMVEVTAYSSTTRVTGRANKAVPAALQDVATAVWALAVDQVGEIDHLEGKQVSVLADGNVLADGTDASFTVASGSVALGHHYSVVHVGLPITADFETLPLETLQPETISDKQKRIAKVNLRLLESRGGMVGPDEDHLVEWPERQDGNGGECIPVFTGLREVYLDSTFERPGKVFVRQTKPLPITILALTSAGEIGG